MIKIEDSEFHPEIGSCPKCGKKSDAVTGVTGAAIPKPGDLSVCFYCGQICCFEEDHKLRIAHSRDLKKLGRSERHLITKLSKKAMDRRNRIN